MGGNLDFYHDDTNRVQAGSTLDGDHWYRWQGVISADNGDQIYPQFMTRNRVHNYDHYDDPFWSDAYTSSYRYYGFYAKLHSYT